MKKTNEIVIDSVHHVLVPDSTSCKTICTDICSLWKECAMISGPCLCSLIMKEPASHFEIKIKKTASKKNNHEETK